MPGSSILRREMKYFVVAQSAWNVVGYPGSSDAFRATKVSIKEIPEREARTDTVDTRSEGATIEGRKEVDWSIEGFFMPSGALGVAPDIGPFLKAGFGVETIVGSTSVTYSFTKDPELTNFGLSIWEFGNFMGVCAVNAIINELSITGSGSAQATFSMSGKATHMIRAGSGTLSGSLAGGETSIPLTAGDGRLYNAGAIITIGTSTNNHVVQSVSTDTLTISPAVVGAQTSGAAVIPRVITPTYAGEPVSKVRGLFQLGGTTYKALEGTVKVSDPSAIRLDEHGSGTASGYDSLLNRAVTFTGSMRLLKESFKEFGAMQEGDQKTLAFNIGDVAAKRGKFTMPAFEGEPPAVDSPEDGTAMFPIDGPAKPTANENELVLLFD